MSAGRPKADPKPFRQPKTYHVAGRVVQRQQQREAKEQKIAMLEIILRWWQEQPEPDYAYIRDTYKRLREAREQLRVLSIVDWEEVDV